MNVIGLSDYHEKNLRDLAHGLRTDPRVAAGFDMTIFHTETDMTTTAHQCGSAACAVGWAPYLLGHDPLHDAENGFEDWGAYSYRVLIPVREGDEFCPTSDAYWKWCFDADWAFSDGTPQGAATRIEQMLDKGLPTNWRAQMHGQAPLSYMVDA